MTMLGTGEPIERLGDAIAEVLRLRAENARLREALAAILPWQDAHPAESSDNRVINLCRAALGIQAKEANHG